MLRKDGKPIEASTPTGVKRSDLCESERYLIDLLQQLGFGRIEDLSVRDGKPLFDPPPRVVATLTLRAEIENRGETHGVDFALKREIVLLLLLIRQIRNGKILLISIRHGLPIKVEVDRAPFRAGAPAEC